MEMRYVDVLSKRSTKVDQWTVNDWVFLNLIWGAVKIISHLIFNFFAANDARRLFQKSRLSLFSWPLELFDLRFRLAGMKGITHSAKN